MNINKIMQDIQNGNKRTIAQSITLLESQKEEDDIHCIELLKNILPEKTNTLRIGISGIPGVGKSTFIEAFGQNILNKNPEKKLSILTIDPSSPIQGGSILGDKTRMDKLSKNPRCFIRPSPGSKAGGISRNTRENILLLEAAGYNICLIETIGVGQSETEISQVVDLLILLQMPATGDELQASKKGLIELADLVVINKCDGDLKLAAQISLQQHKQVTKAPVLTCSSLSEDGIDKIWLTLKELVTRKKEDSSFQNRRNIQAKHWLEQEVQLKILDKLSKGSFFNDESSMIKDLSKNIPTRLIAKKFVDDFFK